MKITGVFSIQLIILLSIFSTSFSQQQNYYVDDAGVIRDKQNDSELHGFGVNYTLPFAHAFRSASKMGVDHYEAMDNDIYHFTRLGFDLFRVHVWDTEISDSLGNLIENEHLMAFDYLLMKLNERGIRYVITPIAFWGGGWPEPDLFTPGFSHKYGKKDCLTNPDAIKAQEKYLYQFMNHKNSFTGIKYKNDPNLIAIEVSNEPHHRESNTEVTAYVKTMIDAIKRSGFKNPVFYNASHGINYAENYLNGGTEGGTFQWYPTGLGFHKELPGNYLPNVDNYPIPFDSLWRSNKAAKIVYEFDAADINKSYIYPAIARTFRKAGIQLATHFSYDPSFLAPMNTEYNTHYMNLLYTPNKALALKICVEIFKSVELYSDFGNYPDNRSFGPFSIDPESDLAVMNDEYKFIYTNSTKVLPQAPEQLEHIAGCGNSTLVSYNGTGAYFLDKIKEGVWRLEVLPDPIIVRDPFGRNSLDRTLAYLQWTTRQMKLDLPDLKDQFHLKGINENNTLNVLVDGDKFDISPGTYIIHNKGINDLPENNAQVGYLRMNEFFSSSNLPSESELIHHPALQASGGNDFTLKIKIISPDSIEKVNAFVTIGFETKVIELSKNDGFSYSCRIPADFMKKGYMRYYFTIESSKGIFTYPSGSKGNPWDWDFAGHNAYQLKVLEPGDQVTLFSSERDIQDLKYKFWPDRIKTYPLNDSGEGSLEIELDALHKKDDENPDGPEVYDYCIAYFIDDSGKIPEPLLSTKKYLTVKVKAMNENTTHLQIALVDKAGVSFGKTIKIEKQYQDIRIPLDDLVKVKTVLMPRPYPTFLPYYFEHDLDHALKLEDIERIHFSIGPGINSEKLKKKHGIGIISIKLD